MNKNRSSLQIALERIRNASQLVLNRAEDWFNDYGGDPASDEDFIELRAAIDYAIEVEEPGEINE